VFFARPILDGSRQLIEQDVRFAIQHLVALLDRVRLLCRRSKGAGLGAVRKPNPVEDGQRRREKEPSAPLDKNART
jgi:hypothetical protein